jgi:hypothetical protein
MMPKPARQLPWASAGADNLKARVTIFFARADAD